MNLMQTGAASEKVLWVDSRLVLDMNRGRVYVTVQLLDNVCYQNSAFAEVSKLHGLHDARSTGRQRCTAQDVKEGFYAG